jgi:cholesterol oxidase
MTETYDYVIIGSGFGGSVSAMRLTEKGYSVLVLEKGKRFEDEDFAKSNWQYWKYLWLPALRGHGILQISLLKGVMVLHGAGVGGGSLGYANVLEIPTDETFATPAWNQNVRWGEALRKHYENARKMLGVSRNPRLWKADLLLKEIAEERKSERAKPKIMVGLRSLANGRFLLPITMRVARYSFLKKPDSHILSNYRKGLIWVRL